jgi:hypothetical protein
LLDKSLEGKRVQLFECDARFECDGDALAHEDLPVLCPRLPSGCVRFVYLSFAAGEGGTEMTVGTFITGATLTGSGLSIDRLYAAAGLTLPPMPGRVGVCLSGGGSRALAASMGQLRALKQLTVNGAPVLGQVRALSTVSGGSWLGVPFIFLPSTAASDDAYLGLYVADQSTLTPAQLAVLPAGNAGTPITSPLFSVKLLALEALLLYDVLAVTPNMIWQTLMALHILAPHGLSSPTAKLTPDDTFTLNATTQAASVTNPVANPPLNPSLADEVIDQFACGAGRITRPYLICNTSMFLGQEGVLPLAPVQTGGLITGILGMPSGTANGLPVGGGAITSFAFNSVFASNLAGTTMVAQTTSMVADRCRRGQQRRPCVRVTEPARDLGGKSVGVRGGGCKICRSTVAVGPFASAGRPAGLGPRCVAAL